jgi:hypothetical protein
MDGQIAPIALLVATAWGSIAENSWCHRNTAFLMETDDMRATKRVRSMIADLDTITDRTRTPVIRSADAWVGSTLYGYVYLNPGNEALHRKKFRMCMANVELLCEKLSYSSVYFGKCADSFRPPSMVGKKPAPLKFRVAACLYTLAHGGDLNVKADVAGIGTRTLREWLKEFCTAVQEVIEPEYMPFKPPTEEDKTAWREQFASRRGVPNVLLACDGTHVKFNTSDDDYRNYKGWHSILCVAFVNSYHMFVYADIGWPGRAGDSTALKYSKFMECLRADRLSWLGDHVIVVDGGCGDGTGGNDRTSIFLSPYRNPTSPDEFWFNFCHSSTRFYVEETFGRWKNRYRFLLHGLCDCDHELATWLIHTSMVLHNFATKENNLAGRDHADYCTDKDEASWETFYRLNKAMLCPSCKRRNARHCVHMQEHYRLTRHKQATGHYRSKAPHEMRDELRDELWSRLNTPAVLQPGEAEYLDMVADMGHAHAREMRRRALSGI